MMQRKTKILIFLLLLSLTVVGCGPKEEATTEKKKESEVPVQVETVAKGLLDAKAGLAGKFEPKESAAIVPKVSGKITAVHVKVGQKVNKGDVLFTLDTVDLQNTVQQSEAAYKVAQASLKQAEITSNQGIDQADSGIIQAKQTYEDAKINLERTKQLFDSGAVASVELEQKETAYKNAEIAYENAKKSVEYAGQKAGLIVARANVEQARVSLENAREQLANATVKAPIAGIVSTVDGSPGQTVGPQGGVVTIVNINPIVVKANLSESEVTSIKVGAGVKVEVPAVGKTIDAKITALSPVMDPQMKAYPFEIEIPNPDEIWKSDMVVNVKILGEAGEKADSIVISRKAVFEEEGKKYVYKIDNDKAVKAEVQVGDETSEQIVITKGLNEKEQVVVKGQTLLSDGVKIAIQKQKK